MSTSFSTLVTPFAAVVGFYWAVTLLHVIVPSANTDGYCCDWKGKTLSYRLNGPLVIAMVIAAWAWLFTSPHSEVASYAARHYWACLGGANALGLLISLLLLLFTNREPYLRCLTNDQKDLRKAAASGAGVLAYKLAAAPKRGTLAHFFFGVEFNPRIGGVDLKMLLYILGAAGLQWNLLSALALKTQTDGVSHLSNAAITYAGMLTWFVVEYMICEVVHLYTYDLFCEKVGFKLAWGM